MVGLCAMLTALGWGGLQWLESAKCLRRWLSNASCTGLILVCNVCALSNACGTGLARACNGWALSNAFGTRLVLVCNG
jgi:hypothetical protein